MREIKFRAWDKKNKKWLLHFKKLGGFSLIGEVIMTGEWSDIICSFILPKRKFEDLKIMQYTGLKDKNGVEIYEGDIIEYNFLHMESGSATDYFGVEPQNSWNVEELYPETYKAVVEFRNGGFYLKVIGVSVSINGEWKPKYVFINGITEKNIKDFNEAKEYWSTFNVMCDENGGEDEVLDFLKQGFNIIGNIYENPELLENNQK